MIKSRTCKWAKITSLGAGLALLLSTVGCSSTPALQEDRKPAEESVAPELQHQRSLAEEQLYAVLAESGDVANYRDMAVNSMWQLATRLDVQDAKRRGNVDQVVESAEATVNDWETKFATIAEEWGALPEMQAWSALRSGQLALHIGCSFRTVRAADDELETLAQPVERHRWQLDEIFSREKKSEFLAVISELGTPFIQRADEKFEEASRFDASPWSDRAAGWKQKLDAHQDDEVTGCMAVVEAWQRSDAPTTHRSAKCREGDVEFCIELTEETTDDDRRTEFLGEACRYDASHCRDAADVSIETGDYDTADDALARSCNHDDTVACMERVLLFTPDLAGEYRSACTDGDGLACLRYARVLDENIDLTDTCREGLEAQLSDAQLRSNCLDDDNPRSCWILGAATLQAELPDPAEERTEAAGIHYGISRESYKHNQVQDCLTEEDVDGRSWKCLEAGRLEEEDSGDGSKYFERACEYGSSAGCHRFARNLLDGGEHERATELLESTCEDEFEPACTTLAAHLVDRNKLDHHDRIMTILHHQCPDQRGEGCDVLVDYFEDFHPKPLNRGCQVYYRVVEYEHLLE